MAFPLGRGPESGGLDPLVLPLVAAPCGGVHSPLAPFRKRRQTPFCPGRTPPPCGDSIGLLGPKPASNPPLPAMELAGPEGRTRYRTHLTRRFEALLEAGDRAVQETRTLMVDSEPGDLQEELSGSVEGWGVTALGRTTRREGRLGWVGVHEGRVPVPSAERRPPMLSPEDPSSGISISRPPPRTGRGTAVAAVLLQANLPAGLEGSGFASRFRRDTGNPHPESSPRSGSGDEAIWDLWWAGRPLLSVELEDGEPEGLRGPGSRFWVRCGGPPRPSGLGLPGRRGQGTCPATGPGLRLPHPPGSSDSRRQALARSGLIFPGPIPSPGALWGDPWGRSWEFWWHWGCSAVSFPSRD